MSVATYYYNSDECDPSPLFGKEGVGEIYTDFLNPSPARHAKLVVAGGQPPFTKGRSESYRRLGLIAEEAPREVLSIDGKGVNLYKNYPRKPIAFAAEKD